MEKEVSILIVEDEFMISEDIAARLSDFGYHVEGIAPSAKAAIEILDDGNVDLALVDVNIDGDTDGIGLAKIISEKYKIPFIFLTSLASEEVVQKAKEAKPSAYLLKPFNDRQVQIAIEMALLNFSNMRPGEIDQNEEEALEDAPSVIPALESLFLKRESHFERVRFDDIYYLSAESNYTLIFTKSGRYVYSSILRSFEDLLPQSRFIRVHRSFIVNLDAITGIDGNSLLIGESKIPVSRNNRDELFKMFRIL